MSRKLFTAFSGLFALTIFVGTAFVPISSASPSHAGTVMQHKPSGLTARTIVNARKSAQPSALVTMAPQSSLKLLSRATEVGPHSANSMIELTVGLKLRHVAKLKSFLQQVQNPASPMYHQWLTPEQFTARYGPSKDDVARVVRFLKTRGIHVKNVSPNRILIHTKASTRVYDHAFGIQVNDYMIRGRRFYSSMDSPRLPRALAPLVVGIIGLNRGVQARSHHFVKPLAGQKELSPRAAPPASLTNMNPLQIAHAYDWPDITDASNGEGAVVAILTAESSGISFDDSPHIFWGALGLPDHQINIIHVDGDSGNIQGINETLLDIEMSGAMAPGITQRVYVAADRNLATFTDMYNLFVDENASDVMTTSFGWPETAAPSVSVIDDQIFMQAAAQGISMFAAAGDSGSSDGTGQDSVADYPSSSPYITSANGTQLTIASLNGAYGTETVWNDADCFEQGPASTGGAISQLFDRPSWQHGAGVPTDVIMRMNSGIALTASCSRPMLMYFNDSWSVVGGTSAVAPMLAGLFAIAVSKNGDDRLGQSNDLIYYDARKHYASDFHDVTRGNNGSYGATPDWDHPTGWGSVDATSLIAHIGISGPKGTLKGTITAAAGDQPVADAEIAAGNYHTVSAEDGTYTLVLPAGDVSVTINGFAYQQTEASVHITDGATTRQDFALAAAATAKLSGKVSDGSGHGYGLYADIKVSTADFGQVAEIWSAPDTGRYTIKLPKGYDYTIYVAAALDGYNTDTKSVVLSGNKMKNFPLAVIGACTAPGYAFSGVGGFSEDFNGGTFPPLGWSVTNPVNGQVVWMLSSQQPSDNENYTGGTGDAASADSSANNQGGPPYDTSLVTPPIPVTSLAASPILRFKANYASLSDAFDLDITTDGGAHWTNILHWTTNHGNLLGLPGYDAQVGLAPYLPASGSFQLRWRYYKKPDLGFYWDWYAQVDDVVIGGCQPLSGGLVVGKVADANTGEGIAGAQVEDDQGAGSDTVANPADQNPDHPQPLYEFFALKGARTLTVTSSNYSTETARVQVHNNAVVRQDFTLKAAQLEATPDGFTLHVMVNNSATASFVLKNTGGGTGMFRILPIDSPPPAREPGAGEGGSIVRIPVQNTAWMKESLAWLRAQANVQGRTFTIRSKGTRAVAPHVNDAWQAIASYPVAMGDNTAARDAATGKVYSMGGISATGVILASADVYDPTSGSWSPIADAPIARQAAVSAFVNGKYYVFNGWDATVASKSVAEVDIYDPVNKTWSKGKSNPVPAAGGSAIAVLDGLVYIVGGCRSGACGTGLSAVQVYDPDSDSWSAAANYPSDVTFAACGGILGKLYCAGGAGVTAGYVYNPVADNWSPIAGIPVSGGISGSFYAAADGLLLMAGGLSGSSITNQAVAYDPQTDSWDTSLPTLPEAVARGGGACGFYQMAGITSVSVFSVTVTANSNVLPGYDRNCGQLLSIPWLTVAPTPETLNAGATITAALAIDGAGQKAFTTSKAYLSILNNTPYGVFIVPLTVTWEPQPVDLAVTGGATPDPLQKGGNLAYSLTVTNKQATDHGSATQAMLSYPLPDGVSYVAANGDATCTAASASSSAAPAAASAPVPGTVTCDFGRIALGASKTETIAVRVAKAGTLKSTFNVTSREPDDDTSNNSVTVDSTVTGAADVSASASGDTIHKGKGGSIKFVVSNAGPDTATDVTFKVSAGSNAIVSLTSAQASQGSCTADSGSLTCNLGDVASGADATVTTTLTGNSVGVASVSGHVTTSADDPNPENDVATASVTVKANGGGGGGLTIGGLALFALLALSAAAVEARKRRG